MEARPEYVKHLIIGFIIIELIDKQVHILFSNEFPVFQISLIFRIRMLTCNGKWKLIFYYLALQVKV